MAHFRIAAPVRQAITDNAYHFGTEYLKALNEDWAVPDETLPVLFDKYRDYVWEDLDHWYNREASDTQLQEFDEFWDSDQVEVLMEKAIKKYIRVSIN